MLSSSSQCMSDELTRTWIAFMVAPLVVPFMVMVYFGSFGPALPLWLFIGFISSFYTYAGVFILGAPIYLLLRACKLTAVWIAPVAGALVGGVVVGGLVAVEKGLMYGVHLGEMIGAPSGAMVGLVFWLIARPDLQGQDRQGQSGARGSNDGTTGP